MFKLKIEHRKERRNWVLLFLILGNIKYEYSPPLPGGHSFDRLDNKKARELRVRIYKFFAKELSPPNPIKSIEDINKAAYK